MRLKGTNKKQIALALMKARARQENAAYVRVILTKIMPGLRFYKKTAEGLTPSYGSGIRFKIKIPKLHYTVPIVFSKTVKGKTVINGFYRDSGRRILWVLK